MARLSEIVALLEERRVDTGATLNLFARRLREAGRVSKAGRGRGAAQMTATDVARFAIAVLATDSPERAADAEAVYSDMILSDWTEREELALPLDLQGKPTMDAVLAQAIQLVGSGELDRIVRENVERKTPPGKPIIAIRPPLEVSIFRSSVSGSIMVGGWQMTFRHPLLDKVISATDYMEANAITEAFERETVRFRTGKNLIARLDHNLFGALAKLASAQ